ncbi:aspartyl/glutamyl-tRNA amidotransferase subunit B [Legionella birminghamensis]|uniref:Aspartyl/glutamyl-tRNA(Asn/Gln) amidotransferase subunit B n=1 Tax=Legionella birminghamensis TaxID=28083 RepID=A0A378I9S8_9GAMM|nr:Asp-tRNA(Asn)/Glu-tRNA(Gln) amidotransferase subunit GatB [Legionella birminghamensis]KTC75596.1 aspartyl/glutamyl-tRNA amidotransferase subunit B [Legionella birminghamensis]STX31919.1 aspartyl-tRNA(Asn)/glutamyl-tRNA (Gln) amidotransferase subunit B [Legionella birminghamensis]
MQWDTVIGLEVHVQLQTKSKLFSGSATRFGAKANTQTSFIDAGLPGVLPVLNIEAVRMAIQFGLAINANINNLSYFERKNYFYPDLPKGYQISQYQSPIVSNGRLRIETPDKRIKEVEIVRAHLEEDAGKSVHDANPDYTGIDLNRAGTALLEIVTAPCLYSIEEAIAYLKILHQLVRFLHICDGNMQEGSFRCDVNLSLKPAGSEKLGVRTELKNLNSFRFIEKAIAYEQARHQDLLENGQPVIQETRLFNPDTERTYALRSKENEQDYRYFPDPDLLPIDIKTLDIEKIKNNLPPLPEQIKNELANLESVNEDDIQFLLSSPDNYHFFMEIMREIPADGKLIINWLKGPYQALLKEKQLEFSNPLISAQQMAILLKYLKNAAISNNQARQIFNNLTSHPEADINELVEKAKANQSQSSGEIEQFIKELIAKNPSQVQEYRQGKEKILGFFVGQVMKYSKGQADPTEVNALLTKYLA